MLAKNLHLINDMNISGKVDNQEALKGQNSFQLCCYSDFWYIIFQTWK